MTEVEQKPNVQEPTLVAPNEPGLAIAASAEPKDVLHFTPAERAARGKAARQELPRSAHGSWEPAPHRRDPIELLEEQAETRLPELVPIRYGRMLDSPFAFFRGGAYLMAADLVGRAADGSSRPALRRRAPLELRDLRGARPAPRLQHQRLRRDAPGPFEWDVKRLAASIAVAGRDLGFDESTRHAARHRVRAPVPRGDGELRADAQPRGLVHAPRRRAHRGATERERLPEAPEAAPEGNREGADEGQHARARRSCAAPSTASFESSVARRSSRRSRTCCRAPSSSTSKTSSGG